MLHNMSSEQLSACFNSLRNEIAIIKAEFKRDESDIYLTRQEVADKFKCDLSTVHNWTKSGKLKAYGIGNRVYYKLSEVDGALVPLR
jgi:excisionase family DNA binding protein